MSDWFDHPLFKSGEQKSIEADAADRKNERELAMSLHFQAADAFAKLAQLVPAEYPRTRSDIAVAAAVSYGCAGHYGRAVKFAELMLAQQGALSARGIGELTKIVEEYAPLLRIAPEARLPARRAANGQHPTRDKVRAPWAKNPVAT